MYAKWISGRKLTSSTLTEASLQLESQAFYDRWYTSRIDPVSVPDENHFAYGLLLRLAGRYLTSGARVLDYGCGDGVVALYAASKGCEALGVDISPQAVARAQGYVDRHGLRGVTFQALAFPDAGFLGPFDLVLAIEVIEHAPDDGGLVRWLGQQLREGGICILSTRLADEPLHRLRVHLKGRDWVDDIDGHLRRYTCERLAYLVRSSGLRVLEVVTGEGAVRNFLYKYRLGGLIWRVLSRWSWAQYLLDRIDSVSLRCFGPAQIVMVASKPPASNE